VDQSDIPDEFPDLPNLCADDDSADDDDSVDILLEDGDHILVTSLPPEEEFIHTLSTTSQQLAEAFHKNTKPKTFCDSVPTHNSQWIWLITDGVYYGGFRLIAMAQLTWAHGM